MSDAALVVERGEVAVLRINRPAVHNALNSELLEALAEAVSSLASAGDCRAIVLTGTGDRAFSAGADLAELDGLDIEPAMAVMGRGQDIMRGIELSPVPVVAAVNGLALGGGFELILSCTFSVFSTTATVGLPETALGLIPGYGGTQRLPRAIGAPAALHVMLTGERLTADRAYALGLTPVAPVEPDALIETSVALAQTISRRGPASVAAVLDAVRRGADLPLDEGLVRETGLAAQAIAGDESTEGIAAFTAKRAADFSPRRPAGEST